MMQWRWNYLHKEDRFGKQRTKFLSGCTSNASLHWVLVLTVCFRIQDATVVFTRTSNESIECTLFDFYNFNAPRTFLTITVQIITYAWFQHSRMHYLFERFKNTYIFYQRKYNSISHINLKYYITFK